MANIQKTIFMLLLIFYGGTESAVLISDFAMTRMIELFSKRPYCKLYQDRGDIQRMFINADPRKVRQVTKENLEALAEVCTKANTLSGELQGGLGFIYPGTKWCGPGSIATDDNDLGRYTDEDKCCREHDKCPNVLLAGECKRGLCNTQKITRSHCDCDMKFRKCLQGLNTETANTLGAVFFNVVQVTCFKERRPCSIHQSGNCTTKYKLYRSGLYRFQTQTPKNLEENSSNNAVDDQSVPRMKIDSTKKRRSDDANTFFNAEIRAESIGMLVKGIFRDFFIRQMSGVIEFMKVAYKVLKSS